MTTVQLSEEEHTQFVRVAQKVASLDLEARPRKKSVYYAQGKRLLRVFAHIMDVLDSDNSAFSREGVEASVSFIINRMKLGLGLLVERCSTINEDSPENNDLRNLFLSLRDFKAWLIRRRAQKTSESASTKSSWFSFFSR